MTRPPTPTPAPATAPPREARPPGQVSPPGQANPPGLANPAPPADGRLRAIDAMRGLVMLLMTLDHVRGHFTYAAYALWHDASPLPTDPLNLDVTTPLFFTMRWVTHLCAPSFILLAGVSVHLWQQRHGTGRPVSARLVTRGLMLAGLNMALGLHAPLSPDRVLILDVLWPIGVSMVLLAVAVHLPRGVAWVMALLLVAGHDALRGFMPDGETASFLWRLAFVKSYLDVPDVGGLHIIYPVLPWFGVMWLGYLCGGLAGLDIGRRVRVLPRLGLGLLAAFVLLRLAGGYGDPSTFAVQDTAWRTAAAFFNVAKYPPSLQFLLVTLGVMWLLLAWFDSRCHLPHATPRGCPGWLVLPGSAPLFYYVAHLVVLRGLTPVLGRLPSPVPEAAFSAGGIAVFTVAVFAGLLPACAWVVHRRRKTRARRVTGVAHGPQAAHGGHGTRQGGGA